MRVVTEMTRRTPRMTPTMMEVRVRGVRCKMPDHVTRISFPFFFHNKAVR